MLTLGGGGTLGSLSGKCALVTGGSRGIGAAIVRRLAADEASFITGHVIYNNGGQLGPVGLGSAL